MEPRLPMIFEHLRTNVCTKTDVSGARHHAAWQLALIFVPQKFPWCNVHHLPLRLVAPADIIMLIDNLRITCIYTPVEAGFVDMVPIAAFISSELRQVCCWRFSFWWRVDLDQRSYSTPGSVSARMGDHLRASKLHVSRYVISHRGQLSLAIPPWVGTMSTGLGWEGNHRSGVALAIRHTQ